MARRKKNRLPPYRRKKKKIKERTCLNCDKWFRPKIEDQRICERCRADPKFRYSALLWGH